MRRAASDEYLPGVWEIPGGRTRDGESRVDAAGRELWEETGIHVPVRPHWASRFTYVASGERVTQYNYLAETATPSSGAVVKLSPEHDEFVWAPLDRWTELVAADRVLERTVTRLIEHWRGTRLIAFEGLDGVGKTTVVRAVADELHRRGHATVVLDEFPDTFVGGYLPALVGERPYLDLHSTSPTPVAQTLLLAASHAYKVEIALDQAAHPVYLLADRYILSIAAYQGVVLRDRGYSDAEVDLLTQTLCSVMPPADLIVYLTLDDAEAKLWRGRRGDNQELESDVFLSNVAANYRRELDRIGSVRTLHRPMEPRRLAAVARDVVDRLMAGAPGSDDQVSSDAT